MIKISLLSVVMTWEYRKMHGYSAIIKIIALFWWASELGVIILGQA
jgi:hypothetical protein